MQNFQLLREAGKSGLLSFLKRGLAATDDEWLNAAEYIISEGNPNVVLCERAASVRLRQQREHARPERSSRHQREISSSDHL